MQIGFRFVFFFDCDGEDDYHDFRLRLHETSQFRHEWGETHDMMFGMKSKKAGIPLDFFYFEPEKVCQGDCIPMGRSQEEPYIYATYSCNQSLPVAMVESFTSKMRDLEEIFLRLCPERHPRLTLEPYWS